jgi:transcriptional regulator with XRE-family HTH domain
MNDPKKVASLAERLTEAVSIRKIRPIDLSRATGIEKATVSSYMTGKRDNPRNDKVFAMAEALNVSEHWLMGYDVPMEKGADVISPAEPMTNEHRVDVLIRTVVKAQDTISSQHDTIHLQHDTINSQHNTINSQTDIIGTLSRTIDRLTDVKS